jgi:hypothetical protein
VEVLKLSINSTLTRMSVFAFAGFFIIGGQRLFAQDGYHVQIGAFPSIAEAQARSAEVIRVVQSEAVVAEVATDAGTTMYRVIVPGFAERTDAEAAVETYKKSDVPGLVRHDKELSCTLMREAANGADAKPLFAKATRVAAAAKRPAPGADSRATALLHAVNATPTTAPQYNLVMRDVLLDLGDADPGKADIILRATHRTMKASPVGSPRPAHWKDLKRGLAAVADGRIPAEETSVTAARRSLCHILHYYDRDKVAAQRGYRQLLSEALDDGDVVAAAELRLQIGAASFEITKENRLDLDQLYPYLAGLWMENTALEKAMDKSTSTVVETVRRTSVRLALMLAEIRMFQERWDEVLELDDVILARYSEYPDCKGEMAEAYTHVAYAWIVKKDFSRVEQASAKALALMEERGTPIWGNPSCDPPWKAYTCLLVGAQVLNQPPATIARIENEMRQRFPNHPRLKLYVP